ncbi:MAG: hypothetical protein WKG01_01400 [Kofleriaceae bacterium]
MVALAALLLAAPRPAEACSLVRTFVPPTNVELVARAPQIVIAKVVAGTARGLGVELEVTRTLRGTSFPKGTRLALFGRLDRYAGASKDRFDFRGARPGAYAGSCVAMDYQIDRSYLLLLDPAGGKLTCSTCRSPRQRGDRSGR